MTGYGRVSRNYLDKTIIVEIRSLNSKFTDLRLKAPQHYKEKEPDIRKILTERLERGKIDFTLEINSSTGEDGFALNIPLFKRYVVELRQLSAELKVETGDLLQAVLRLPNVVSSANEDIEEKEWENVYSAIKEAIEQFEQFRASEGNVLKEELRSRIVLIQENLEKVGPLEGERVVRMRQRLHQNLEESLGKEKIDENRFEQEIIHYLEKLDITEEKVRLAQHCKYFIEELSQPGTQKGRKLSFISQEIGREINTLGAKAYSSEIQRLVVVMKDELEKIKEQVANCL
ncbi:YicC/YloC family endoribonuclease [Haliscomenobacter sp.]|uniref:YicC/YloC family endoribonuclease n=1 Tax=Haliscomenobacter sp. TaxID=2717303 RepID=UPI00359391F1